MGREQHPTIINISTHALREEGDVPQRGGHVLANISTHALREEGDAEPGTAGPANRNFYPRPPRGGRPIEADCIRPSREFLPTPSARRATKRPRRPVCRSRHFYPRPPRGGRRVGFMAGQSADADFYPRPPRGGRPLSPLLYRRYKPFLPTPSARRATHFRHNVLPVGDISTHALREEGD